MRSPTTNEKIAKGTSSPTRDVFETDGDTTEEPKAIEGAPDAPYLTGLKLLLVMTGLTVVMLLAMLDMVIISTAIPQITSDFHRLEDVGWYVGAYQLAAATVQPLTGKLYTYFSTKWTYLCFFLVFELGSVLCGAANSSTMLIVGRAVAGLGCSGIANGTLTVLVGAFTPERRPLYTAIAMGVSQIGIVMGPLLGGAFTEHVSWRWCFYINLPLGGLAAVFLTFIHIPDQTVKPPVSLALLRRLLPVFDLTGFALFAPAAIMFLLALQFGSGEYGWSSSEVIGLFCGAAVTFALFLFWEYGMGDDGMIPLPMIRQRVVWTSCLNMACLMTATMVGSSFMPIYFQSVKGLSPTMSGVYMLGSILSQVIFVVLSGALVTKFGYYTPWALFAAAGTAIGCGLISTWSTSSGLGMIIGFQVVYGIRGSGIQIGIIAIQNFLPPSQTAVGNSTLVFFQNLFSAIFVTIANTIFQSTLRSEITTYVPSVNPEAAIAAGGSADAVRKLAPPGSPELAAVLEAYLAGFRNVLFMLIGVCIVAFLSAFGMGWVDLRKKKEVGKSEA
ncbi:Fc.00g022280.m01.CDS01 [Cosmosporella sp. VM-42]